MKNQKGFTLIELLVVIAIIGILSGIAFVSISGAREGAYDTQIRSELSQIRSNAEQYYYDPLGGRGSYENYDTSSGWENIKDQIPPCSVAYLPDAVDSEYQISISDNFQRYAAWAPLCAPSEDDNVVYYCIDSDGNAGEHEMGDTDPDSTASNCDDVMDTT